jgi:hypothetical protein
MNAPAAGHTRLVIVGATFASKRRDVRVASLSFLHTVQHVIIYGYLCLVERRGERVS